MSKTELALHRMEFESKNRSMKEPVGEIDIPVGDLTVKMCVPQAEEEAGTRLSFWWGITTAAVALSRRLHAMGNLSGKRVIELGCGLGLAGVTAALLGAEVTFTDYVPEALEFAEKNALLNGLRLENTSFRPLDWERPEALDGFDLVLGSEILYEYFFHDCLMRVIEQALGPGGTVVLADRKRLVVSRFLGRLRDKGFCVRERVDQIMMQGFPIQKITVFELARR